MKILSASQIRDIDQQTLIDKKISSTQLMESAAIALFSYINANYPAPSQHFTIVCGNGNNGGDGLALARLLIQHGYAVTVYLTAFSQHYSADNKMNQTRLAALHVPLQYIHRHHLNIHIPFNSIIIDALLGSGLNRETADEHAALIDGINKRKNIVLSVDLPSGLYTDQPNSDNASILKADVTLCLQIPKWALLLPQNAGYIGHWELLNIGLSENAIAQQRSKDYLITQKTITDIYQTRSPWAHKGNAGHSVLIGSSIGKAGAITLSASACMRSGSGLTSCYIPACNYTVLQTGLPSAMVKLDSGDKHLKECDLDLSNYQGIGIGPGMGTDNDTLNTLKQLLEQASEKNKPVVIDADALNLIASDNTLLSLLPKNSVLTPHPKEFIRLAGESENDYERLQRLKEFSRQHHCIVVLKGRHTTIVNSDGNCYVNNTGNAGMAKGGSGDVLTGIITALLAQGYSPINSAQLGVYIHGRAADLAVIEHSIESLMPDDVIRHLGYTFRELAGIKAQNY